MKKRKVIFGILFCFFLVIPCIFAQEEISSKLLLNPYPVPIIKEKKQSLHADFIENQVFDRIERYFRFAEGFKYIFKINNDAQGINRFDEVPDNSFFVNRNGKKCLTLDEIAKGSNTGNGPDVNNKWTIIKGKSDGDNAGFIIKDSRGDKYLIKLDRKKYPEMNSAAEVIGARLFHAIGYNVPEYTICYFKPDILTVADNATYYAKSGFKQSLTMNDVLALIKGCSYKDNKGRYRCVASKWLDGKPLGYVSFSSSKKQDVFDLLPHQERREYRALRVFSSWLNHHDIRRGNTIDVLIQEKKGWYLKQYLIDFGACLGSHNIEYKYPEAGHMYVADLWEAMKAWLSFGFYKRPYHVDADLISPSIGYITYHNFFPKKWKPIIPNYAFDKMTNQDAFWAAKIVMSFSDQQIKAVVDQANFTFEDDGDYLVMVLKRRRDMIGEYWFSKVLAIDDFRIVRNKLIFSNLNKKYDFKTLGLLDGYKYDFRSLNPDGSSGQLLAQLNSNSESVEIPSDLWGIDFVVSIFKEGSIDKFKHSVELLISDGKIMGIKRN